MAITDNQVAALRAYLSAGTDTEADDAERQFLTLARTGNLDGIEVLVYGAFAAAARRRFSPTWTSADIVRFVADFRSSSVEAASLITASAAENQLRGALGEKLTTLPDQETRARAQVLLLAVLTASFTPHELDGLLSEGRTLADSLARSDCLASEPVQAAASRPYVIIHLPLRLSRYCAATGSAWCAYQPSERGVRRKEEHDAADPAIQHLATEELATRLGGNAGVSRPFSSAGPSAGKPG